ncbi:MAG: AtpZ/AtpI family protein [Bacillota bacterium]|nr:AtpZ/AtpI family protein [Bacillota bacterium]
MSKHWYNLRFIHMGLSFGINFAVFGLLGGWGGQYLDRKFHSEPWFLVAGITFGVLFALYSLVREIMAIDKITNQREKAGKDGPKD